MKLRFRLFPVFAACAAAMLFCSSCEAMRNRDNMKNVRVGMTKDQVKKIMGEPLDEPFCTPEIWYYYTDHQWFDGMTTRDECTPFVFDEFDRLEGFGNEFYKQKFKTPHWTQKAINSSVQFP